MVGNRDPESGTTPVRGRGTALNPANRFDKLSLDVLPPADQPGPPGPPGGSQVPTRVYYDSTRTIINRVDSPDLPFRWTINPYRGCEHGCTYCIDGETRVLMADRSSRRLGDLRPGDEICGTVRQGRLRRLATTSVLAHWETHKPAYRLTLQNGTEFITSADHRFLTPGGWKLVDRDQRNNELGPPLTVGDLLLGIGAPGSCASDLIGAGLRVATIELLGTERQLFDITTGTGDFIANGIVSHNCYARPTHEALGFSCGLDFETKIVAKPEAPRLLRQELSSPGWRPEPIVMSGVTDPYQPLEAKLRITRACLEVLADYRQPVSLVTKSRLICRDLDLLAQLARCGAVGAAISVTTLDPKLAAVMEPRASRPQDRLRAIRELSQAGIPVMVLAAPIVPGLNDREIPAILRAASEAGARSAAWVMLRLPHQVKTLFLDWLRVHFPDRAARIEGLLRDVRGGALYDARFGTRQRGSGAAAEQIAAMFKVFARRYGLDAPLPRPSADSFRCPEATLFDDLDSTHGSLEPAA